VEASLQRSHLLQNHRHVAFLKHSSREFPISDFCVDVMAGSSCPPAAPAVPSLRWRSRCQQLSEAQRRSRDTAVTHCWLRAPVVLVIVTLISILYVSEAQSSHNNSQSLGTWSTAQLSVTRFAVAATSVGNVAIFAGGSIQGDSRFAIFDRLLLSLLCRRFM
jgi:hypothetical protein